MNPLTRLPDAARLKGPGRKSRFLLFVLVFCLPLALASLDPDLGKHARFGGAASAMLAIALLLGPVWGVLDWALRRQHLALGTDGLTITTSFYKRSVPLSGLKLEQARVVNLAEHIDYKPRLKTNGTSLPGIKSGWFRLANGNKALVSIRQGERVLWLPTSEGYDLLIEPVDARQLIDHLQQVASGRTPA
ncbi:PH domain-containing protein [Stenotrophomonas ginsengisoli]|nr:PH domain-containing protein [Stenotrophomonas ginsengisoli]